MTEADHYLEDAIRKGYAELVALINLAHHRGLSVHIEPIEDRDQSRSATIHLGGAFIGVSKTL